MADQLTFYQFRAGSIPIRFSNNKRRSNWIGRTLSLIVREFNTHGISKMGLYPKGLNAAYATRRLRLEPVFLHHFADLAEKD